MAGEVRRGHQIPGQHDLLCAVLTAQPDRGAGDPDDLVLAVVEGDPAADAEDRLPPRSRGHHRSCHADPVPAVVAIVSSASGEVRFACR
ncbi:hypothetical protein [Amycolatopsis albispora]|uniref:hypothetical protein n=1 Tax=Amycolatopsis albispora TaxID=1804986 RepID=UPI0019633D46|nr:hypothetical protein [Amycolatopsis albispora]